MRKTNSVTLSIPDRPAMSGRLALASAIIYDTQYPGGLYGACSFWCPMQSAAKAVPFAGGDRVVIKSGVVTVYEGYIENIERVANASDQGLLVTCQGAWAKILMRWGIRKPWADQRITQDVWVESTTAAGAEKCTIDRNSRIQFTQKAEAWTAGNDDRVTYTAPTGETVKRITFDYNLQEGGQAWRMGLYNSAVGATVWSATASGSGSVDHTLATPSQSIRLYLDAQANQTPTSDGTYFARFANITVYTETGAINGQEIAKDVRAKVTSLNADESNIGALTLSLVPFIAEPYITAADILSAATAYGDASYNRWAAYCRESGFATTPDGKPVLVLEQWPVLTGYDYSVRLDGKNVVPPISADQDYGNIWNWIVVEYYDANGDAKYVSPDDDGTLADTASVAAYGRRFSLLSAGHATLAEATNLGRRWLAAYKDPQWRLTAPIQVVGHIHDSAGKEIPAAQVRAGQRIKVMNFLQDLSGNGLTFLITQTSYSDAEQIVTINTGEPDLFLADRIQSAAWYDVNAVDPHYTAGGSGGGSGGGGGKGRLNWKRKLGLKEGTAEWEDAANDSWSEKQAKIKKWRDEKHKKG